MAKVSTWTMRAGRGTMLAGALAAAVALAACGGKKKANQANAGTTRGTPVAASATVLPNVPLATPGVALTPVPQRPTPAPATPLPSPTPNVRQENGLQIVDESFDAVITASGGVRIRSAPQVAPDNVVGSLPEGALVHVEGRVLNGAEGEPGKGTVWCIVGVKQYIYCGEGYIHRASGPTPTPAR